MNDTRNFQIQFHNKIEKSRLYNRELNNRELISITKYDGFLDY